MSQEASNVAAQAFWRRVIGQYTQERFAETQEAGWDGPTQVFRSPGASPVSDSL